MIIQTIQEVIASPILGSTGLICVIAAKESIENDEIKTQLRNLNVSCGKLQEITTDMYAMCLNYTIQCRIAPLWNKVGQYYIHGLEFCVLMKKFNALKVKVTINGENAQFYFYATKITIPFIKLEDLGLLDSLIAEFLADNNGIINLSKHCLSVYILPSMKTGKVISVFKKIPSHCPFKNYYQLRKYWIDMYDYYLPQTEEGIVYYEVKFLSGTSSFIYPSVCVATGPAQFFSCINADSITSQFVNALLNTLSKICNKQLFVYNKNKEQNHQLTLSGNNTGKINIQEYNHLSLSRDKELIMNNIIDKDSTYGLEHTTRHECDTSVNLCKSNKAMTSSSVKRSQKDSIDQLETCNKFMKFERSKQTNLTFSNDSLMMKNKTHNVKIETTGVDENTTPFFKDRDLCQISNKPQVRNNTPVHLTLKQKLLNAMRTTKFGNNIDVEEKSKYNTLS
ncbi:hypothetical protein KPH14_006241 [Odynerus spinipes]|uniref:DUF4708 domain-containing protein n=1 Tax=Odynerus spinipes TaxID=1348599 RepID=A0AAD9RJX0_9HYME|nr:hypothetical protein KPH14_006241 [Odynerus spinipes]